MQLTQFIGEKSLQKYTPQDIEDASLQVISSQKNLDFALEYYTSPLKKIWHDTITRKPAPDIVQTLDLQEEQLSHYVHILGWMKTELDEQRQQLQYAQDSMLKKSEPLPEIKENPDKPADRRTLVEQQNAIAQHKYRKQLEGEFLKDYVALEEVLTTSSHAVERMHTQASLFRDYVHHTKKPLITIGLHAGALEKLTERVGKMRNFTQSLEEQTLDATSYILDTNARKEHGVLHEIYALK